jgi:hypothetical protein
MKECYCFVWKKAIFGYFLYVNVGNSEDSLGNAFGVLSSAETQAGTCQFQFNHRRVNI